MSCFFLQVPILNFTLNQGTTVMGTCGIGFILAACLVSQPGLPPRLQLFWEYCWHPPSWLQQLSVHIVSRCLLVFHFLMISPNILCGIFFALFTYFHVKYIYTLQHTAGFIHLCTRHWQLVWHLCLSEIGSKTNLHIYYIFILSICVLSTDS